MSPPDCSRWPTPGTQAEEAAIARQTGFAGRDRMRRAFLRAFGQPPQVIRRNARAEAMA
jgi:transcriptional regulator GlxA family with amidase domain